MDVVADEQLRVRSRRQARAGSGGWASISTASNGTLYTDYGMPQGRARGRPDEGRPAAPRSIPPSPGHEREWLDSIKSRQQPSCNPEYHTKVDVPFVLANLSLKLGRSIRFDAGTEKIVGDEEASRLSKPEYRAPWKFPEEYL